MLIYFLPFILFLGIITSYEDIKFGKIRNKWIIAALFCALIINLILIFFYLFTGKAINFPYFVDILINASIALAIGFFGFYFRLWSSGDAKLLLAYSALVPLTEYSNYYIHYFPSFVLLINTFVPFFFYASVKSLIFTSAKQKVESIKTIYKRIFTILLRIIWITWLPRLFAQLIGVSLNLFINIAIILTLFMLLNKFFKKSLWKISLALCILRLIFDFKFILSFDFLKNIIFFLILIIFIQLVMNLSSSRLFKEIKIKDLKKRMLIAESIYEKNQKYEKGEPGKEKILIKSGEILSDHYINTIKNLYNTKKLNFSTIKIHQTLPFAPFMFSGVLITIATKSTFLIPIIKFIYFLV